MFFPRHGWEVESIHHPSLKASYIDNYWLAVKETDEHGNPLAPETSMGIPSAAPAKDAGETPRTDAAAGWIDAVDGTFRTNRQYSPCGRELEIRNYVPAEFARTLEREAAAIPGLEAVIVGLRKDVANRDREAAALREELTAVRPYADCYKRVCESLGIEDNILSYVRSLQAALADGKGSQEM